MFAIIFSAGRKNISATGPLGGAQHQLHINSTPTELCYFFITYNSHCPSEKNKRHIDYTYNIITDSSLVPRTTTPYLVPQTSFYDIDSSF